MELAVGKKYRFLERKTDFLAKIPNFSHLQRLSDRHRRLIFSYKFGNFRTKVISLRQKNSKFFARAFGALYYSL